MTHQLLLHANRSSQIVEKAAIGMPEGIPAEIRDTNRLPYRMQMIIPERIGVEWPARIEVWKEPLLGGIMTFLFPPQQ